MRFTASSLIAGFIFGVIGIYLFREGKRQVNYTWVFTGMGMMVYTMFTQAAWQDWGIGLALCAAAYYYR
jgi:multisubunit Na+/H+ antiporter MnhE subunit